MYDRHADSHVDPKDESSINTLKEQWAATYLDKEGKKKDEEEARGCHSPNTIELHASSLFW
jgi:hypothetical protein